MEFSSISISVETVMKPETFAEMLCEDFKLPHGHFVPAITSAIRDQIQDHFQHFPQVLNRAQDSPRGNNDKDDATQDAPELRFMIKVH